MEWHPIETCPNDDSIVLWHVPGKRVPVVNRADDYWSGCAYWLEDATHWAAYEPPKE